MLHLGESGEPGQSDTHGPPLGGGSHLLHLFDAGLDTQVGEDDGDIGGLERKIVDADLDGGRLDPQPRERLEPDRSADQQDRRSRRHVRDDCAEQIGRRRVGDPVHVVEYQHERHRAPAHRLPERRGHPRRVHARARTLGVEVVTVEVGDGSQCRDQIGE